jgi:hypothetical protein
MFRDYKGYWLLRTSWEPVRNIHVRNNTNFISQKCEPNSVCLRTGRNCSNVLYRVLYSISSSCLLCKNVKFKTYRTLVIDLPVVSVRVWNLVCHVKAKHKSRVSENRVLRRNFGPQRYEQTEGLRKPYNKELRNMCPIANIKLAGWSNQRKWARKASRVRRREVNSKKLCCKSQENETKWKK